MQSQCTATVPPLPPRQSSVNLCSLQPNCRRPTDLHGHRDTLSAVSSIICSTRTTVRFTFSAISNEAHRATRYARDEPPKCFLLHDKLARPHDHLESLSEQHHTQTRPRTRSPGTRRPSPSGSRTSKAGLCEVLPPLARLLLPTLPV